MGAEQKFDWATSAASTLDWWREAGVDTVIAEEPRNWLAPAPVPVAVPAAVRAPALAAGDASAVRQPVQANGAAAPILAARALAPMPATLGAFDAWRRGPDAPDAEWPGRHVFAQGSSQPKLAVIVEMPEREDGEADMLLSGVVGKLFDRMLAAIGHDRTTILLLPMCAARPSTGRLPAESLPALEATLRHHVMLAAPKRVLLFGNAVSRALIGADIAESRGTLRTVNQEDRQQASSIQAVASYHPRFLLERPAAKAEAWKDLLLLIQGIDA
ncbi:MAG: hypothetical protein BVN33_11605 [Proteobacteria bacterium ST_bin13]|nr:MAG: hypothetical protein BVN33_11605 [Proteobacteria bacterium ST_bin13]